MTKQVPFEMPPEEELAESWARRLADHKADPNCITYWWPRIAPYVPTPRTEIVPMELTRDQDKELWHVMDGQPMPDWWNDWIDGLRDAALRVSSDGPWFLRTGVFSGKHRWGKCCAVADLDKLSSHVFNIFEMSQLVDIMGLPYHVWAIREWLPGPHLLIYEPWEGMPVRREFRAFAEAGEVRCIHPYWPPEAFDTKIYESPEFEAMNALGDDEDAVRALVSRASEQVKGEWSVDCLWTYRGWYVTDMAVAQKSYHWPECERLRAD